MLSFNLLRPIKLVQTCKPSQYPCGAVSDLGSPGLYSFYVPRCQCCWLTWCTVIRTKQILLDLEDKLQWSLFLFFGLNPANTLKPCQNIHLSEEMKNTRLLNPELRPSDLLGLPLSRWAPRPEEGRRIPFLRYSAQANEPLPPAFVSCSWDYRSLAVWQNQKSNSVLFVILSK